VELFSSDPPKWGSRNPSFKPAATAGILLLFKWEIVQRLFSTFADGWPGVGLLLLRLLTGVALMHFGIINIREGPAPLTAALQTVGIAAGIVLLVGIFTPVAGALAATAKVWIAIARFSSHSGDPWIAIAQAILAAALAMTGPGAWSIDARRFGRKHIRLSDR
jgi:putative oxidoreductase